MNQTRRSGLKNGEIMYNKVEATLGAHTISIETGKLAKQASGSVVVRVAKR